jgi:uncharacterized integral membrane protein
MSSQSSQPSHEGTGSGEPDRSADRRPDASEEHTGAKPGSKDPLRGSRASGMWAAMVLLVVILVLVSVFVMQNTQSVTISYFGWTGEAPLAATLLIAVAAGLLLALAAGSARILQLRHRVRREQKLNR